MKTQLLSLLILLAATLFPAQASAQVVATPVGGGGGGNGRDPRDIAAAFTMQGPEVYFKGQFEYWVNPSDGPAFYQRGKFVANANTDGSLKEIVSLELNGQEVPLATPLKRFIHDLRGKTTGFWLYASGHTKASPSQPVSYGDIQKGFLDKGEPITLELRPNWVNTFVSAKVPDGVSPDNLRLVTKDGGRYWYDQYSQGFNVWMDPVKGSTDYTLVDASTGNVVQSGGRLNPYLGATPSPDNAISTTREGGVVAVPISPTNTYWWRDGLKFNTTLEHQGQLFPARVWYLNQLGGGNLRTEIWGNRKMLLQVHEVLDDGSRNLITETVVLDEQGSPTTTTKTAFKRLVVSLLGSADSDANGFGIQFSWQPPSRGDF